MISLNQSQSGHTGSAILTEEEEARKPRSPGVFLRKVFVEVGKRVQLYLDLTRDGKVIQSLKDIAPIGIAILDNASYDRRDQIAKDTCAEIAAFKDAQGRPYFEFDDDDETYVVHDSYRTWAAVWEGLPALKQSEDLQRYLFKFVRLWLVDLVNPLWKPLLARRSNFDEDGNRLRNPRNPNFATNALERDAYQCAVTKAVKVGEPVQQGILQTTLEVAHIIPHHLKKADEETRRYVSAFELFGGLRSKELTDLLDTPANAIPLDISLHRSFDRLEWSIEAKDEGFFLRFIRKEGPAIGRLIDSHFVQAQADTTLVFGEGNTENNKFAIPDGRLCNLHHAICRVVRAAGMADVFAKWEDSYDGGVDDVPSFDISMSKPSFEEEDNSPSKDAPKGRMINYKPLEQDDDRVELAVLAA